MNSLPLVLARVPGPLVTGFLATFGSLALGMGVMTDCTTSYSCSTGTCSPCLATSALVTGGWALQGVLFATALALWLPAVVRRLSRRRLVTVALLVPLVSALAFAGVAWTAERSYCRPGQDSGGHEDYCDVQAQRPTGRPDSVQVEADGQQVRAHRADHGAVAPRQAAQPRLRVVAG